MANPPPMTASDPAVERIADAVLADLLDRRGFRQTWDGIDDDIRAEIRQAIGRAALSAIPQEQGWQPIETAPRDGTEILLWGACEAGEGRYAPDRNVGWWGDGEWRTRHPDELCAATAWQPLPSPPAAPAPENSDG